MLADGTISGTDMNSLNHYSYGSVLEWMYRNMAGLHLQEDHPGFVHVKIAPQPDYRIRSCDMEYRSVSGTYEIHWKVEEDGTFALEVTVPFGTGALVVFPNTSMEAEEVTAGTYRWSYQPQIPIIRVYSSALPMNELLENSEAKTVMESYIPGWESVPGSMRDMTVEQLNDTPFVNLTREEMEAMNARLNNC